MRYLVLLTQPAIGIARSDFEVLTLRVGHWTKGLRAPETGAGAAAAAFCLRASRRAFFCAGWLNHVFTRRAHFLWKCWLGMTLLCLTILFYCLLLRVLLVNKARAYNHGVTRRQWKWLRDDQSLLGLSGGRRPHPTFEKSKGSDEAELEESDWPNWFFLN